MSILSALGFDTKKITNESLRRLNLLSAAILGVQGLAILLMSNLSRANEPVTIGYRGKDTLASEGAGEAVLVNATRHLFDINLAYLIAALFFIGTILHLVSATRRRKEYEANIKTETNKLRWIEFGISTGLMVVVVLLLVGVTDLGLLILAFGSSLTVGTLGLLREKSIQSSKNTNLLNYWSGVFITAIPVVVGLLYILGSLIYGDGLPISIYSIFLSLTLLLSGYALFMYLQHRKQGRWKSYLYGERTYIVLSLVAKTVLGWQIFLATLRT